MRPGGDHRGIGRDVALVGQHGAQAAALDAKAGGGGAVQHRPLPHRMRHQRRHIGAGVGAMPAFLDQHAEGVAAVEIGFALAQVVRIQFDPAHADLVADLPRAGLGGEIGARGIDVDQPAPFDQVADAGLVCQGGMQRRRIDHQRAQRARGLPPPAPRSSRRAGSGSARVRRAAGRTSGSPADRADRRGISGSSSTDRAPPAGSPTSGSASSHCRRTPPARRPDRPGRSA